MEPDEFRIIGTVEDWAIEKTIYTDGRRAVIVAEDMMSHSMIALFTGVLPLIVLRIRAIKIGENMTLVPRRGTS